LSALVNELDRVFDRDDVALTLAIDLVDHGREGRRFTGTGRTSDEHESARFFRHLGDRAGQPKLIERLDRERNLPHHHRYAASLLEHVAAEAGEVLNAEREIELVLELEALLLLLREDRVSDLERVFGRQLKLGRGVCYIAIDAKLGTLTGDDVKVGRIAGDHFLEQRAEVESLRLRWSRRGRRVYEW